MIILGLETSTAVCSVGLSRDDEPDVERSIRESHIHSEKLLSLVQEVVQSRGLSLRQIDVIAISIGPGSFTGLRIGLSTAKGLSFALDKPVVAVSTFEAMAVSARRSHPSAAAVNVVIDARGDEWYLGRFHVSNGLLAATEPVTTKPVGELAAELERDRSAIILTDKPEVLARMLNGSFIVEDVYSSCRGDEVASVGFKNARTGVFADVASLEPVYLKDFIVRTAPAVS
jgi:tRNA threonylcarbamoyladenosine biosynthesis protein TsaB